MGQKNTLQDIARLANVSPATVSRLASGSARVKPEAAERVMKAAASLGVDLFGKRKGRIIGFLLANRELLHPFHSRILLGVQTCLSAHDIYVLFLPYQYSFNTHWRALNFPEIWRRRDVVSGLVVVGSNAQNLLKSLSHKKIPYAVFGNNVTGEWPHQEHDSVWIDDIQGTYEMTRHLQSLGHRDIWFVSNNQLPWFARRYEGYRRAMEEAGLTPRASNVDSDKGEEIGFLATKTILGRSETVSAILAGDDYVARGSYRALNEHGLKIPEDVSVVGCSEAAEELLHPPLTTVRVFPEQVGRHLAQQLLNRLMKPHALPQHSTIPTQLVMRASCQRLVRGEQRLTA